MNVPNNIDILGFLKTMLCNLQDLNDYRPEFRGKTYNASVCENAASGKRHLILKFINVLIFNQMMK